MRITLGSSQLQHHERGNDELEVSVLILSSAYTTNKGFCRCQASHVISCPFVKTRQVAPSLIVQPYFLAKKRLQNIFVCFPATMSAYVLLLPSCKCKAPPISHYYRSVHLIMAPRAPACAICPQTASLSTCSGCHILQYYSRPHQVEHRPVHKALCKRINKARVFLKAEEEEERMLNAVTGGAFSAWAHRAQHSIRCSNSQPLSWKSILGSLWRHGSSIS